MCHNVKLGFIQRLNLGEQKLGICQRTNRSVAKTDGARNNPAFNMAILDTVRHCGVPLSLHVNIYHPVIKLGGGKSTI